MADTLQLEIATPEKEVAHVAVDSAQIPAKDGYLGILPGHAPLLSELGEGELSYVSAGTTSQVNISGGYVEVRDNHIRVLADKTT